MRMRGREMSAFRMRKRCHEAVMSRKGHGWPLTRLRSPHSWSWCTPAGKDKQCPSTLMSQSRTTARVSS